MQTLGVNRPKLHLGQDRNFCVCRIRPIIGNGIPKKITIGFSKWELQFSLAYKFFYVSVNSQKNKYFFNKIKRIDGIKKTFKKTVGLFSFSKTGVEIINNEPKARSFRMTLAKDASHTYILMTRMPSIISLMSFTLSSATWADFTRNLAKRRVNDNWIGTNTRNMAEPTTPGQPTIYTNFFGKTFNTENIFETWQSRKNCKIVW